MEHIAGELTSMSGKLTLSLSTLPVELFYRILDNLTDSNIL